MRIIVGKSVDKSKIFTRKDVIQFEFEQLYQFTFFSKIRFLLNFIVQLQKFICFGINIVFARFSGAHSY